MSVSMVEAAFSAPLCGISIRWPKVLHAVEMREIVKAWPDGTVVAACGVKGLRVAVAGDAPMPWPPAVAGLAPEHVRCRECWVETGRKRPRSRIVTEEER